MEKSDSKDHFKFEDREMDGHHKLHSNGHTHKHTSLHPSNDCENCKSKMSHSELAETAENVECAKSDSSLSSSSFSLSDEETPEQKAEWKQYCSDLKAKYGLDKLPKFNKLEKMSNKVRLLKFSIFIPNLNFA